MLKTKIDQQVVPVKEDVRKASQFLQGSLIVSVQQPDFVLLRVGDEHVVRFWPGFPPKLAKATEYKDDYKFLPDGKQVILVNEPID